MFAREGIEDPLSTALLNITADKDEGATEAKVQILAVFLIFCQASQKDSRVREALANRRIIRRVLNTCNKLEPALLVVLLKSVYHLATTASTLEVLQNANAIEIVTDVLADNISGPHSTEISNHVRPRRCRPLSPATDRDPCPENRSYKRSTSCAGSTSPDRRRRRRRASFPFSQRSSKRHPHSSSLQSRTSSSSRSDVATPLLTRPFLGCLTSILLDFANAGKTTRNLLWQKRVLPSESAVRPTMAHDSPELTLAIPPRTSLSRTRQRDGLLARAGPRGRLRLVRSLCCQLLSDGCQLSTDPFPFGV